jgi:hypothetical protein
MIEVKSVLKNGEEYTILKCDDNFKLSTRVSSEFPDFVLLRKSTVDIIVLMQTEFQRGVRRFLLTGTPGIGKTVSIIVWLYFAIRGELKLPFKYIIAGV